MSKHWLCVCMRVWTNAVWLCFCMSVYQAVMCQHSIVLMGDPLGHMHTFECLLQLWRFQSVIWPFCGDGVGGALMNEMEMCHFAPCLLANCFESSSAPASSATPLTSCLKGSCLITRRCKHHCDLKLGPWSLRNNSVIWKRFSLYLPTGSCSVEGLL